MHRSQTSERTKALLVLTVILLALYHAVFSESVELEGREGGDTIYTVIPHYQQYTVEQEFFISMKFFTIFMVEVQL